VTSLVIAMAVDRGYFKYTDRVSQYWPEFSAHNKDDITIEDMMRHEGGLSHLSRRISFTELADLDSFAKVLAESPTVLPKGYR
jgi:CubicO group peptidase (beta-lactamase class C family)